MHLQSISSERFKETHQKTTFSIIMSMPTVWENIWVSWVSWKSQICLSCSSTEDSSWYLAICSEIFWFSKYYNKQQTIDLNRKWLLFDLTPCSCPKLQLEKCHVSQSFYPSLQMRYCPSGAGNGFHCVAARPNIFQRKQDNYFGRACCAAELWSQLLGDSREIIIVSDN